MGPLPVHHSPYDAPMWQSIQDERMKLQRSPAGVFRYPPGPACPVTLSLESEWVPISGRAKVLSWTVFHKQYLPAYPAPTLVVAVQLEEGPIMVSNMAIEDVPHLRLDVAVDMVYETHPDGYKVPRFKLAARADA